MITGYIWVRDTNRKHLNSFWEIYCFLKALTSYNFKFYQSVKMSLYQLHSLNLLKNGRKEEFTHFRQPIMQQKDWL